MQVWQRHILGFAAPMSIGGAVLAFAPENDAPDWMIATAATALIIAISYAFILFGQWMQRHKNQMQVSAALIAIAFLGPVLAITFRSPAWFLTLGLGPVAVPIFLMGYFGRMQEGTKHAGSSGSLYSPLPKWAALPLALLMMAGLAYSFANGSFELLNKVLAPMALAVGFMIVGVRNLARRVRHGAGEPPNG